MPTDPPPPLSPPAADALDARAAAIESHLRDLQRHQRAMRTQAIVASLLIALLLLTFGFATYRAVSQQLTREELQTAFAERAGILMPQVGEKLAQAAQLAAPHYRDVALQRMQAAAPRLREQAIAQFQGLPGEVEKELTTKLEDSMARVTTRLRGELAATFPGLTGEQQEQLLVRLAEDLGGQTDRLQGKLESMVVQEGDRIQKVLLSIDTAPLSQVEQDELERRLVHHLIMLADYYVTGEVDEDDLDPITPRLTPIAAPNAPAVTAAAAPAVPETPAPETAAPVQE